MDMGFVPTWLDMTTLTADGWVVVHCVTVGCGLFIPNTSTFTCDCSASTYSDVPSARKRG